MFDNIILVHGLSGDAEDMDYIATRIAKYGCMISNIELPGHGTMPESLLSVTMDDWIDAVENEVKASKNNVAIIGQSMGALLAIYSAIMHPDRIKCVVLLSPAIKLYGRLNRLFMSLIYIYSKVMKLPAIYYTKVNGPDIADPDIKKGYAAYNKMPFNALAEYEKLRRLVLNKLSKFKTPLLIVYSKNDHTISQDAVEIIDSKIKSNIKEIKALNNSFHVISIDRDREKVVEEIDRFLRHIN